MTIIRSPRPDAGWYALDRRIAEDARLSWAARGLLVFLLTKPDHWRVSVAHLVTQGNLGRDAVRGLLRELIEACYITRIEARTTGGEFGGPVYFVHESPQTGSPETDFPAPVKPGPVDPPLDKTKLLDSSRDKTKEASLALCAQRAVDKSTAAKATFGAIHAADGFTLDASIEAFAKVKRASRLPDEWTLPDEWRAEGLTIWPDCDIQREVDRFRDYWTAQPGQRGVKVNWRSTWRNWIRKAQESAPAARGGARGPEPVRTCLPGSGSTENAVQRAVAWARQMVEFGKWTREEAKAHVDEAKRKHGGAHPAGV